MTAWETNRDGALVCSIRGLPSGGVWRGAWKAGGRKVQGFLAASWAPSYHRLGRFGSVREAKEAVEEDLSP